MSERLRRHQGLRAARRAAEALPPEASALSGALKAALDGRLEGSERDWVARIEGTRARLEASPARVKVPDHGAGGPPTEITVGEMCRRSSKPPLWAGLLFRLVRDLRLSRCLELGTCVGVSTSYQAAALELNGAGSILTLEGAPDLAEVARETVRGLGLDARAEVRVGPFAETLDGALGEGSFDMVFVDGHHDERATLDYFERIAPHVPGGGIVIFDDIDWSEGMARAWRQLSGDPRLSPSVDLGPMGVCVVR